MAIDDDSITGHPSYLKWLDEDDECLLTGTKCDCQDKLALCQRCDRSMNVHIANLVKLKAAEPIYNRKIWGDTPALLNEMSTVCRIVQRHLGAVHKLWWTKHLDLISTNDWPNIFVEKGDCPYFYAFLKTVRNDKPRYIYWKEELNLILQYRDEYYVIASVVDRPLEEVKAEYEGVTSVTVAYTAPAK